MIDSVFKEQINYRFDESKFKSNIHLAVKSNVPEILSALLQTHLIDVNVFRIYYKKKYLYFLFHKNFQKNKFLKKFILIDLWFRFIKSSLRVIPRA